MAFVYRFKHYITNEVIYVGQTSRKLNTRMNEHFGKRGHLSDKCYSSVGKIEYIEVDSSADALLVEQYFINKYKPKYNISGKSQDSQTLKFKLLMTCFICSKWDLYEIKRSSIIKIPFIGLFKKIKISNFKNGKSDNILIDMVDIFFNIFMFYLISVFILEAIKIIMKI